MSKPFDYDLVTFWTKYFKFESPTNADKVHIYIGILSFLIGFLPNSWSYNHDLAV